MTVISPVFNEEESVEHYFKQMMPLLETLKKKYSLDLILKIYDNASNDASLDLLTHHISQIKEIKCEIISWVRNYGVMTSLYGAITESNSDVTIVIDFDLQDTPELISQMIERWLEGYTFVYGSRFKRDEKWHVAKMRGIFSSISKLFKINADVPVESGLWLLDRSIIEDLTANPPLTKYLAGAIGTRGYRATHICYVRNRRKYGESKFSTRRYMGYAFEALTSNPSRIARFSTGFSLFTLLFGIALEIFFLVCRYVFGIEIPNGAISSIFIQVVSFAGIFLALGFIGEYIANISAAVCRPEETIARIRICN